MKMFTKLIRLTMTLLLLSAIVVVQAQSGKQTAKGLVSDTQVKKTTTTITKSQGTNSAIDIPVAVSALASEVVGEPGDSFDPNFDPQAVIKGTEGTDDVTVWALPSTGGTSGNTRAPGNTFNYQRTEYLILASELAAVGMTNGNVINSIGFLIQAAGVTSQTGTLNVYLMNTTDVTYTLGASWTTTGFTLVNSNASFTVPISPAGYYDIPFTGGSPFTYTGGGIYVAWEFSNPGTVGTGAVVHYCNTSLANSLYGQRSTVSMPTTLVVSAFRPATRLGLAGATDVLAVTNIYTLEKVPVGFGTPTPIDVRVANVSAASATFNLTVEVRDVATNTLKYTSTQSSINLAANTGAKYNFTGWNPTTLEDVKIIAFVTTAAGETWLFNNTLTIFSNVNNNLFSYFYTPVLGTNYGFGTGSGCFLAKYHMNGTGLVTGANLFIGNHSTATGNVIYAVMFNSAGTIVAQSPNYTILAGDLATLKSFTFTSPVVVSNADYYVGLAQTVGAVAWYCMGSAVEAPQRGGTFYTAPLAGGLPGEFTGDYKYLIEAQLGALLANDVGVSLITSPASGPVGVQNVTITVFNGGTSTQSNIPVSYTYNSNTFNGTVPGPLATGASVSYTFPTTINPPLGANTLTACTNLVGDGNAANDCNTVNFNISPPYTCLWSVNLYDDFGDGWNGAQMDVIVDGYTLLDNITLAAGTGPVTYTFGINTGSAISTAFVVNGGYPEECIYEIVNNFGTVVGSSGPTGVVGVPPSNLNLTGNCECQVICPVGGIAEGEAQIPDLGTEVTNGGCNMASPLFTNVPTPTLTPVVYCGQTNTYITATGTGRDTDWYRFDATSSPATYWNFNITCTAEFSLQVLLIDAGADNCTDYSIVTAVTVNACETATINADYPSGIYYIWVGPQTSVGNPYPYGGGPYDYVLSYTGTALGYPVINPAPPATITKTVAPGGSTTENLTIGNSGTYKLDYSAVTSGTFSNVWNDQFDTYAAGVQLALQNPTDWTTWSAAPGSAEDPVVSSAQAYTGANSVLITGVNDCVHLFPNYTSGSYKVSHRMYVTPGNVGYYNTLLSFDAVNAVYEWGMQVAFEVDGTATLDAGVFAAATFTYTPGTWMLNEVYVDLDNDYAEYWFNGTFVWSWQWSVGTGGYTTNQLAANNFYAYTGTGGLDTPLFYIDDYRLEVASNDWLTINGGLGANGSIAVGAPAATLTLGINSTGKPVGTYTKTINLVTNELSGAKNSYTITVNMIVGYALSGNVYYGNTGTTKPMATNTTVTLTPGPTVNTEALGVYDIRPLANGTYKLSGTTTKAGGGITTADGITVARFAVGIGTLTNLQLRAADVNKSNSISTSDGILVKRRAVGLSSAWAAPVYVFDGPFGAPNPVLDGLSITISGANVVQEFRTICSGDVNGSYTPPAE